MVLPSISGYHFNTISTINSDNTCHLLSKLDEDHRHRIDLQNFNTNHFHIALNDLNHCPKYALNSKIIPRVILLLMICRFSKVLAQNGECLLNVGNQCKILCQEAEPQVIKTFNITNVTLVMGQALIHKIYVQDIGTVPMQTYLDQIVISFV